MNNTIQVAFAAINEKLIEKIPENVILTGSSKYALWGKANDIPRYYFELYKDCPTLQTIINGFADYVVGDGVVGNIKDRPNPNETWDEFVVHIAGDYILFGVAYIQIIRNLNGEISELYWLDSRFVRTDEDEQAYWYNEDFAKKYVRSTKTLVYPKFVQGSVVPVSVLSIKTPFSRDCYGTPIWESAIKSVVTEVAIDDFHCSEIDNNFSASAVLNFNNGIPTDEQKDELEKMVTKKFTGHQNAGRFLLSFNNGKDNATTIERLATDDFDKRYVELANKTQKQIFTAFGVSPVVFGVEKETTGFNSEDFQQAFKLFNRTKIKPIQGRIIDTLDKIFNTKSSIVIKPFTIDWGEDENKNNNESNEQIVK